MIKNTPVEEASTVCRITAILSYSKGFVCSMGPGSVCLFEKTEENSYRRIREIKVKNSPGLNKTLKHNQIAPPSYYYTPHTHQQCVLVQQAALCRITCDTLHVSHDRFLWTHSVTTALQLSLRRFTPCVSVLQRRPWWSTQTGDSCTASACRP